MPLTLDQFEAFHKECKEQPPWRTKADREADYLDGNQLDSDILRKQQSIGMPPAIEPLMGPALSYVCGMEAKLRQNWRVIPNSDVTDDDVAEALNVKLNEAERHAKADKACSNAFRSQAGLGLGWVEVSRNPNPFHFKYRAVFVHRNEIWYDWKGSNDPSMLDHRYFIRRRWTDKQQAQLMFPDQVALIEQASTGWSSLEQFGKDGGHSTGLQMSTGAATPSYGAITTPLPGDTQASYPMLSTAYQSERGSSIEEQEWRDTSKKRVALFECWYRVWERALVFKTPDGRVIEYDKENDLHLAAVVSGAINPEWAIITKVRLSWWLGPHLLSDDASPYKHNRYPYVPFWNKREDRTGVPYGLARGWMYLQDTVNATLSKLRWGLSAVRTTRTKGAVVDDDNTLRREIARSDADIILDPKAMKDGGVFKVERDFELTDQQNNMLQDSREGMKRVSAINSSYMGEATQARSGLANHGLVEQASLGQGELFDNFQDSRNEVGELLLSMIIEDITGVETPVTIKGTVNATDRVVRLNSKVAHPATGEPVLTNDVSRTILKVTLEDVPNTPSYRQQQLQSFSEVFKSTPTEFQRALFPQFLSLMDVPNKDAAIKAVREAAQAMTPDQIQAKIEDAVKQALAASNSEYRNRQLEIDQELNSAKVKKLLAESVATMTTAQFEAMQAAGVVIAAPQAAPVADEIMKGSGFEPPAPAGISPNITAVTPAATPGVNPVPPSGGTHPEMPVHAALGARAGIETS